MFAGAGIPGSNPAWGSAGSLFCMEGEGYLNEENKLWYPGGGGVVTFNVKWMPFSLSFKSEGREGETSLFYPVLRSRNFYFSAPTPAPPLFLISAAAPVPAKFCYLKLFYNSSAIGKNGGRN